MEVNPTSEPHGTPDPRGNGEHEQMQYGQEQLRMIQAAMMEELGIGRKDTLPLQDKGTNYEDLQHSKSELKKNLPRKGNDAVAAWNNIVFDDVNPAEAGLSSIADGQLYRMRRGTSTEHQQPSARGSFNARQYPGRGVMRGNHQSIPVRGSSGQGLGRSRGGASSRGGHFYQSRGGHSSRNANGSLTNNIHPPIPVFPSHGSRSGGARRQENPGMFLTKHPEVELAIRNLGDVNGQSQKSNRENLKTNSHQINSVSDKSDSDARISLEPVTDPVIKQATQPMARPSDKHISPKGHIIGLAGSRWASVENHERWKESRPPAASATDPSFGKPTVRKITNIRYHKQDDNRSANATLRVLQYDQAHTLSLEISADGQLVLNDFLYAECSITVEKISHAVYRPALRSAPAWYITFEILCVGKEILALLQESLSSAPNMPDLNGSGPATSTTILEPVAATNAIHEHQESKELPTGLITNPEPSFTLSDDDEEWLVECFGNYAKSKIIELHKKGLSWPNAKADIFGSVWSGTLPSEIIRNEIHQEIHRIFQSRLETKFHPENQKIQIQVAPSLICDLDLINKSRSSVEQMMKDSQDNTENLSHTPPTTSVANPYPGSENHLSGRELNQMCEVAGLAPLISFSDAGDDIESIQRSEYIKDLIDIEDGPFLEGVYNELTADSQSPLIGQLSTLIPTGEKLALRMSREELLASDCYFSAAMNVVGTYLTKSEVFNALPDAYNVHFVQEKTRKIFKRAVGEFYKPVNSHDNEVEDGTIYADETTNGFQDSPKFIKESPKPKTTGLEASRWAMNEHSERAAGNEANSRVTPEEETYGFSSQGQRVKYTTEELVQLKGKATALSPEKLGREAQHLFRSSPNKVSQAKGNSTLTSQSVTVTPGVKCDPRNIIDESPIQSILDEEVLAQKKSPEDARLGAVMTATVDDTALNTVGTLEESIPQTPGVRQQGHAVPVLWQQFASSHQTTNDSKNFQPSTMAPKHQPTNSDYDKLAKQLGDLQLSTKPLPDPVFNTGTTAVQQTVRQPTPIADSMTQKLVEKFNISMPVSQAAVPAQFETIHRRLRAISGHFNLPNSTDGDQVVESSTAQDHFPLVLPNPYENLVERVEQQSSMGVLTTENLCVEEDHSRVMASAVETVVATVSVNEAPLDFEGRPNQILLPMQGVKPIEASVTRCELKDTVKIKNNGGLAASKWANPPVNVDPPHRGRGNGRKFPKGNMHSTPSRNDPAFQATFYPPQQYNPSRSVPAANVQELGLNLAYQAVLVSDTVGRLVEVMAMVPNASRTISSSGKLESQMVNLGRQENIPFPMSPTGSTFVSSSDTQLFPVRNQMYRQYNVQESSDSGSPAALSFKPRGRSENIGSVASPTPRPALSPVRQGDNVEAKLNSRLKHSLAGRSGSPSRQE